ncbi:SsrA-binding protein SmpB [bacterium]|nr:SsrA-binding protein SmpB [bacterium]
MKLIAKNKKASFAFEIDEVFEAGIELKGSEVKSIRAGKVSIKEAYGKVKSGEIFIIDMYIKPYETGMHFNPDPNRVRRLLLHKQEINKIARQTLEQGYTLVPLEIYISDNGLVKLKIATAKGRKLYDKKRHIAEKEANRRQDREIREALKKES